MLAAMNAALVVVDVQNGFIDSKTEHVVPRVVELVAAARASNVAVVFTRFRNTPGSAYQRLIGWDRLRDSPEIDIVPALAPFADRVVDKNYYSALTPGCKALIAANGWQTLFICGVATDACVLKTAVDAFEHGLTPVVVHDACASNGGSSLHEAGLAVLARLIGRRQIVDCASVLETLRAGRGTRPL
jgi:nicotinamidase-related amidase